MAKQIIYDSNAKEKILAGVNKLEKAVSCTLGPCGKNVIIDEFGSIHSTKDGVTVAKSIVLKDPFENLGVNAIKEVADKSNTKVGDGTTTSTLLAATIYRNGLKYVNLGANATQVKNGIKKTTDFIVKTLKELSTPISTKEDIERVATVSANGDKKIGSIISDVMSKIGNDGTIKIEDSNTADLTSKIVEGMVIDQSYASPYMVTNLERMEAELDNPFILIINGKFSNIMEIIACLNEIAPTGRPLFVIADDYAEDVLGTLVMNRMRPNGLNTVAIKSPSYGENRKMILEDIATLCGGRVVSDETGTLLKNVSLSTGIIGQAKRVVVTSENTVIIGGCGNQVAIENRINALRKQVANCTDEFDKGKLEERLAKMASGIGIISVGATTESERKELRDRVDDAFCAAKTAIKNGVVPGGGSALLNAKNKLDNWKITNVLGDLEGDEAIGVTIVCESLEAPIRKILENAGIDASLIVSKLLANETSNTDGYNVLKRQFVNMVEDGIIDPTEVVINEIQNAASVAGLLLTTECLICEEVENKKSVCQTC